MRTIIRRASIAIATLAVAAGLSIAGTALTAGAVSASPPPANNCPLWANYVLHHPYPHCYANLP
jgi:hypothetical protein